MELHPSNRFLFAIVLRRVDFICFGFIRKAAQRDRRRLVKHAAIQRREGKSSKEETDKGGPAITERFGEAVCAD